MDISVERLKKIEMLIMDVDGILTDCHIWMHAPGDWRRKFSILDGVGIKRLQHKGYTTAIITGSKAMDIQERVKVLEIPHFYEGALDKLPAFLDIQNITGISNDKIAYIGDDIFDVPVLNKVQFAATVPKAVEEVKDIAHYITQRQGGDGAVREVCDLIYRYGAFA